MTPNKIIFLDIDGVLNYERCPWFLDENDRSYHKPEGGGCYGIEPGKVDLFNSIFREVEAKVVLSSTWRLDKKWVITMQRHGIRNLIGRTPRMPLPGGAEAMERGYEIKAWIERENEYFTKLIGSPYKIEKYAIIDDDSDMLPEQLPNFFQTSWKTGLTQEIVQRIIAHLKD